MSVTGPKMREIFVCHFFSTFAVWQRVEFREQIPLSLVWGFISVTEQVQLTFPVSGSVNKVQDQRKTSMMQSEGRNSLSLGSSIHAWDNFISFVVPFDPKRRRISKFRNQLWFHPSHSVCWSLYNPQNTFFCISSTQKYPSNCFARIGHFISLLS